MIKKILLLFVIFCSVSLHAQQILNNSASLNTQLPSNTVLRVFQDKEGFIWFGTKNGLCRYDGYNLLVFRSELNNPNLLTSNEITSISESSDNYLLIGTEKGINILNKDTYQIHHFSDENLNDEVIRSIIVTADGNIWIGTMTYIYKYNSDFSFSKRYDKSLPTTSINSIYEDKDGNIWTMLWQAGLHKYNPEKDIFEKYPTIGENDNPFKLFQDKNGDYWICTWGDGIYSFNPNSNNELLYKSTVIENDTNRTSGNHFFSITQDNKDGYLWVVSTLGIHAFQPTSNGKLKEVKVSHLFKESNNIFSEIYKDNQGNLWVGTFGEGAFTINFNKPQLENYPMLFIKEKTGITPNITAIYKDKKGRIWLNQNRRGLGIFDPKTNSIRFYYNISTLKNISELETVSCISQFKSFPDEIWIGAENQSKIFCLEMKDDHIKLNRVIDLSNIYQASGDPRMFYEDNNNNIWVVTTNGLLKKSHNKKEFEWINAPLAPIQAIAEDKSGNIWLGIEDLGLQMIASTSDSKKPIMLSYTTENSTLISNNIKSLSIDINNIIWIGTQEGNITKYNIERQEFIKQSIFFNLEEEISNIVTDEYNHIWISTNKRMIEFNVTNQAFRDYTFTDGVIVNSFEHNSFHKEDSSIYFGGNKGITVFSTSRFPSKSEDISAIIGDIRINNQSVFYNNNNEQFNIKQQTLKLNSNDKNIEIYFSSLNYTYSDKIKYAYKMKGVDDDWVYVNNGRQFAVYNQLSKGSHTFYVKATDENRLWSDSFVELSIYKYPAFYETWWAYTIYLILIISLIYDISQRIKRRIVLRNNLKIMQIEKDKTEELTQAKLKYFTNISHDLLTPLTIMSCIIDDLEITNNNKISQLGIMRSSINKLKRLLQQILDFRKVESGNMKLKILQGDIVQFLNEICLTNFSPLIKKKNINFSFHSNPSAIHAFFDADKIDKIIFNLLSNAFKYTPDNGSIAVIMEQFFEKEHSYVRIKISDTGRGISPKDIDAIFTRFYTNRKSDACETNGIGLSLVKELLDIHLGTIKVESKVEKGSIFTIEIPIDKDSYSKFESEDKEHVMMIDKENSFFSENRNESMNHLKDADDIDYKQNELTILLVEDNEELLLLISNILSKSYSVLCAKNGIEALGYVKNHDVDIIISDVMMPGMDGLELCKIIKNDIETSHIPVLLLTAKNSAEDRVNCYNAGADSYISKPFEVKVLKARIENFISNRKKKQYLFKSDSEVDTSKLEYSSMDDLFLNKVISTIDENLMEVNFDISLLADNLNISKSSLYRKIKVMTGLAPIEFIRNIKLKQACQMLKNPSITIKEVAYASGFSNPRYFSTCFKKEFGVTPTEYQANAVK